MISSNDLMLVIIYSLIAILVIAIVISLIFYFKASKKPEKVNVKDVEKDDVFNFMEFDEIRDNMIIRQKGEQNVMVIQCQGINFDLMSEGEKIAVENGFTQFLNALNYPIQLYVQTRSLNLNDTIKQYKEKVGTVEKEIEKLNSKLEEANKTGNIDEINMIQYEIRRKRNVLEYGNDITNYIGKMSLNKSVLQQKMYVILSYNTSELNVGDMPKEEKYNMIFSELYTRAQSVSQLLNSCGVSCRVLNSEELAELLYIAYNRDDSELISFSAAVKNEYDNFYSTAKDVLDKKKEEIEQRIQKQAIQLASNSIINADNIMKKEEEEKRIKEKASSIVKEYEDQMDEEFYSLTQDLIRNADLSEEIEENSKKEENDEDNKDQTKEKKKRVATKTKKATSKK